VSCLGQHFAMLEMTLVAALMLQRFVWALPAGPAVCAGHERHAASA